jgi:hypothetical protein
MDKDSAANNLPGEMLAAIAEHLQLTRFIAITVGTQTLHDLVHGFPGWLVFVEEIAGQQNHIHVAVFGDGHDFVKRLPTVVAADGISFVVAHMVVGGD